MSTEQRERRGDPAAERLPPDSDVSEQRRQLREQASAQPLPADVTATAGALGGVPTAEVTVDGIEVTLDITPGVPHVFQAFTRSSTKRPWRSTGPDSSCRRISPDHRRLEAGAVE